MMPKPNLKQISLILEQIYPIYGLIVLIVFNWSLYNFVWYLPSWLDTLTLKEIISIFLYTAWITLIDSLTMLIAALLINFSLPKKWFIGTVSLNGSISIIFILACLGYLNYQITSLQHAIAYALSTLVLMIGGLYFIPRIKFLGAFIMTIAEKAIIFIYVFLPVGLISALFVLVKRIFS